ncbi:MAG: antirestriction protein ArdA [Nocardioidaceae bacterium]
MFANHHEREDEQPEPKIWVASLSDYNNGVLHGAWLDANRDPSEVHGDIQTMLATSPTTTRTGEPAEEWAIHNYEGFGQFGLGEYDSVELVCRIARGIAEHGLAFAAYAEAMDGDEDALGAFTEAYLGHYRSVEAYAEQLVDDLGYQLLIDAAVPENLRPYVRIDTAALARDMELAGDIHALSADDGGVWLFDAR